MELGVSGGCTSGVTEIVGFTSPVYISYLKKKKFREINADVIVTDNHRES